MIQKIKSLGPGLLFAGAAIGVSHLVQSTRAGADFGMGLIWALVMAHLFKYPFFQFGARYTQATQKNLLEGYHQMHPAYLTIYFIVNLASMFTIQAAITLVTTGLALNILDLTIDPIIVSTVITSICTLILILGQYKLLDKIMKIIILTLTCTTISALMIAAIKNENDWVWTQKLNFSQNEIPFLIAFLGWMPAPLDVSIWQSIWSQQKMKQFQNKNPLKTVLFDFNIGYITTFVLGLCFLSMGAIVMHTEQIQFPNGALGFCKKLINMYTLNLGETASFFIAFAAFTTMFSTTLTALDASPRGMKITTQLFNIQHKNSYLLWILILNMGTILLLSFFKHHMFKLIKIATILSFLTAPFFAILNFKLITSHHTPKEAHPTLSLKILSYLGILFLIGFSIWYIVHLVF